MWQDDYLVDACNGWNWGYMYFCEDGIEHKIQGAVQVSPKGEILAEEVKV